MIKISRDDYKLLLNTLCFAGVKVCEFSKGREYTTEELLERASLVHRLNELENKFEKMKHEKIINIGIID